MKIPPRLLPLLEYGLVDEVLTQLMSGKEAQVYVVRCGEAIRCAKVYKEANKRSFKQAVQYQEGRQVRNSRRARAMSKKTRYGQKEAEDAWLSAEVDALYKLAAAGVRVPQPYSFIEGVLLMELITDENGDAAPRLGEVDFSPEVARHYHSLILQDIVRMLCAGLIHGDLSEFNVLVDAEGPVIIDLPQAVNAAGNNSAARMLERDVQNMARYFGQYAPELLTTQYGKEIWELYEAGKLHPAVKLSGQAKIAPKAANVEDVLSVIDYALKEELAAIARRQAAQDD